MKKKIIILVGSLVLIVCCILLVKHFLIDNKDEGSPIVQITFPQYAGVYNENLEFVFEDNYDIENEEILHKAYTTNNKDIDKMIKKIRKRYDVSDSEKEMGDFIRIGEGDRYVTKYGENAVQYTNSTVGGSEVTLSDDKCVSIAEEELKKLDLLVKGMEYSGVGYDEETDLQTNESKIIGKTVYFSRELDGVAVKGNSTISVSIVGEGDIKSVYYACGAISKEYKIADENIISLDEAIEACKNFEGYVVVPDNADKVVVESVECVYWEDSAPGSENKTIQPVYRFVGKAYCGDEYCGEFVAIESALEK